MSWKKDKSQQRVRKIAEGIGEITISDLTRKMNLGNVKLHEPKRIQGAHLYLAPANEKLIVDELLSLEDTAAARAILRQVHLFQREAGRIISDYDVAQIHFQGSRLHALGYRPVGDPEEVVARVVMMAAAIDLAARQALVEVLPDSPPIRCHAGAAYGRTVATMSGSRTDSELLFIGDAANRGAKVMDPNRRLRVTQELWELVDAGGYGVEAEDLEDGTFGLTIGLEEIEDAASKLGGGWTLDRSRKRLGADADKLPLESFSVSKLTGEIDKERLGRSNSKLNDAASAFADLDGFTAIVEEATSDRDQAELVRVFHITRAELNAVRRDDYKGTFRVQYQGDRIQTLRHLPHDDAAERAIKALQVAAGMQTSIREVLPEFTGRDDLRLAIGIAAGPTILSKLGTTGNRDVLALGPDVRRAERIQRNLDSDEAGISGSVYEQLPGQVQGLFEWRAGAQGYVAEDLRVNALEYARQGAALEAGEPLTVSRTSGKHKVDVGTGAGVVAAGPATAAEIAATQPKEHRVAPKRRWAC